MTKTATKYIEAVGRRKCAISRARVFNGKDGAITVNGKTLADYFQTAELQAIVTSVFEKVSGGKIQETTLKIVGGGIKAQAEAARHSIARVYLKVDAENRKELKKAGFLKRDPRVKERRKFGLKKARKAPQWSKR